MNDVVILTTLLGVLAMTACTEDDSKDASALPVTELGLDEAIAAAHELAVEEIGEDAEVESRVSMCDDDSTPAEVCDPDLVLELDPLGSEEDPPGNGDGGGAPPADCGDTWIWYGNWWTNPTCGSCSTWSYGRKKVKVDTFFNDCGIVGQVVHETCQVPC